MRILGGVAIAALIAVALSGCTVIGSLGDKAQIDLGLASLSSDLKEIPGVTDVTSTAKITGDYRYTIVVNASGEDISDASLAKIGQQVLAQLGGGVFDKEEVSFALTVPEGLLFSVTDWTIDAKTLDEQLEYRAAFAEAYGAQVAVGFEAAYEAEPPTRQISALAISDDVDWDEIRSLPDSWTGHRYWGLGSLGAQDSLPSPEVTELADAIAELGPFASDFWVNIGGWRDSAGIDVTYPGLEPATLTTSAEWPLVVEIAKRIAAARLVTPSFAVIGDGFSAYAFFGDCATEVESYSAGDEELLAEALGTGWHAGACPIDG